MTSPIHHTRREDHFERRTWSNMLSRCNNPNTPLYRRYGGRGIRVTYTDYSAFIKDVGLRPSNRHSIDRIDNDGDYAPGNCRWALAVQQARNTSANRTIHFNGETRPVVEWAERIGIKPNTLLCRLNREWPIEKCLTRPTSQRLGEDHNRAKLTEAQVMAIRSDTRKTSVVAKDYSVSRKLVDMIRARRIWTHV